MIKWVGRITRACWVILAGGIVAVGFFPRPILSHLHLAHIEIVAFELFLLALFALTILLGLRAGYLKGVGPK
jgi:hypothetical protein